MSSYEFIFGMLLYIFVVTSLISAAVIGMGYSEISTTSLIDYETPSESVDDGFEIPFISDALDSLGAATSFVGSLLTVFAGILIWTLPDAIFPLWANIIFIKIPLIALVAAIVEMLLP